MFSIHFDIHNIWLFTNLAKIEHVIDLSYCLNINVKKMPRQGLNTKLFCEFLISKKKVLWNLWKKYHMKRTKELLPKI
jgi:hypothetical protein